MFEGKCVRVYEGPMRFSRAWWLELAKASWWPALWSCFAAMLLQAFLNSLPFILRSVAN